METQTIGAPTTQDSQTELESILEKQGQLISDLYLILEILHTKLLPVLREPPVESGTPETRDKALVGPTAPLTRDLTEGQGSLENVLRGLRDLTHRLVI